MAISCKSISFNVEIENSHTLKIRTIEPDDAPTKHNMTSLYEIPLAKPGLLNIHLLGTYKGDVYIFVKKIEH